MSDNTKQIKKDNFQGVWFCVNKNNKVVMFTEEPKKNKKLGIWESKFPYVNSILYKEMCEISKQAKMNFETEPQYIEIKFGQF